MSQHLPALLLALSLGVGCGGAAANAPTPRDPLTPLTLFPLQAGSVWTYDVDTGVGLPTLGVRRVVAATETRAVIQNDAGERTEYELRAEGIYEPAREAWILRAPIREGAEWPSGSGRVATIVSVEERVETPHAGTFEGCVRVEESGDAAGREMITIYCPDVGPVVVEVSLTTRLTHRREGSRGVLRLFALVESPASPRAP